MDKNKASMTTNLRGEKTVFFPYNKDIENPPVQGGFRSEYVWKEILLPDSLLDILNNFAHISIEESYEWNPSTQDVEKKEKEVLIFPRYHQLDLINKLKSKVLEEEAGHNYLVQHTTGSGKSYSIGWLSHTLSSLHKANKRVFDSIIVVTDRTVLDDQLKNTINSLAKTPGVVVGIQNGSSQLRTAIDEGEDIIVTTIQKFPFITENISSLRDKRFAVVIDEVHSSQSGELSRSLNEALTDNEEDEEEDYEDIVQQQLHSRGRQEHISFFGFTGTPKERTLQVFGRPDPANPNERIAFHYYHMKQSIAEGFTLDVLQNYSSYKRLFKIKEIESSRDRMVEGGARQVISFVDSNPETIKEKAGIILEHWLNKGSKQIMGESRGMVVVRLQKDCVQYFLEINKQLKEKGEDMRALVAFSGTIEMDGSEFTEKSLNKSIGAKGKIPVSFKNPKYRLLIVCSKYVTGFDEPLLHSMYIDKKLKTDVQCVQTLSRLNRTSKGKEDTFVLDFTNDPEDTQKSFQKYYKKAKLIGEVDFNKLYDKLQEIQNHNIFSTDDVEKFSSEFFRRNRQSDQIFQQYIDIAVDNFNQKSSDEIKKEIRSLINSFLKMYEFLSQIITFQEPKFEKHFRYLKFVAACLPRDEKEFIDIRGLLELEFLKIEHQSQESLPLDDKDSNMEPENFESAPPPETLGEMISEIISRLNYQWRSNFDENDIVTIETISTNLQESEEIEEVHEGNNSQESKEAFFNEKLKEQITNIMPTDTDLYNKIMSNPEVYKFLQGKLYETYNLKRSA